MDTSIYRFHSKMIVRQNCKECLFNHFMGCSIHLYASIPSISIILFYFEYVFAIPFAASFLDSKECLKDKSSSKCETIMENKEGRNKRSYTKSTTITIHREYNLYLCSLLYIEYNVLVC